MDESEPAESRERLNVRSVDEESREALNCSDKSARASITGGIGQKIRSKLPSLGNFLRRLTKQRGSNESRNEDPDDRHSLEGAEFIDSLLDRVMLATSTAPSASEPDLDDGNYEHLDRSNYFVDPEPGPSTSGPYTERFTNQLTRERIVSMVTSSASSDAEPTRMISNSMNTSVEAISDTNFTGLFSLVAGSSPFEFATGLALPFGTVTEEGLRQPRSVPLIFVSNEETQGPYPESPSIVESGISASSTAGSEASSVSDSDDPPVTRNQRTGQDQPRRLQELPIRLAIRKPLARRDDESAIY